MTKNQKKKAILKEYSRGTSKDDPTVNSRVFDFSNKFSKMQLCFIGDVHFGTPDSNIEGVIDNLKYASQQENAIVFFMGDMMNAAILGSKSDIYAEVLTPQAQLDLFTKILTYSQGNIEVPKYLVKLLEENKIFLPDDSLKCLDKAKSNIATINEGNHEARIYKAVGISPSKTVAETAGVDEAFAPYFSNTEIKLKNNHEKDKSISFKIVGHHGTGNSNIDHVVSRYPKQVDGADLYVIGHTHDHVQTSRRYVDLKIDENGQEKQVYRDVEFISLPASGGGTYAAGMSLPKRHQQTAVWMEIEPQINPQAGKISATGVTYPDYIVAKSFFSPSLNQSYNKKMERPVRQAKYVIRNMSENLMGVLKNSVDSSLENIKEYGDEVTKAIIDAIRVKPLKEPKGFVEYLEQKQKSEQVENLKDNNGNSSVNEMEK